MHIPIYSIRARNYSNDCNDGKWRTKAYIIYLYVTFDKYYYIYHRMFNNKKILNIKNENNILQIYDIHR